MLKGLEQEQWPLLENGKLSVQHKQELECQFKQKYLRFSANNEFHLHILTKTNFF